MQLSKTKIVCTIGPATWDPQVMRGLIENGMNVARVNGAFADEAELEKVTKLVRDISSDVALMVDVKGPEVRMNKFAEAKPIKTGDIIVIGNTESDEIYPANHPDLYQLVQPGQRIVVGDGDIELTVKEIQGDKMHCEVIFGDILKPGKALNLPGVKLADSALTPKDIVNLKHALSLGWDFVSASFIQNAQSAREVNQYLQGGHMKLIAKIEDQTGIDNIDEILPEVEGIMIARGGLGVELGLEKVPMVQRMLTEKANKAGKMVITATQMLESMTEKPRPTRAEVNDVALAVMLGTDAVMLSGESSAGKYPVEAVQELSKISLETEKYIQTKIMEENADAPAITNAIAKSAAEMCHSMGDQIDVVLVVSLTGRTARLLGRHRISQPIFAFASDEVYARRMMLSKGVNKVFVFKRTYTDRDQAIYDILQYAKEQGAITDQSKVLLVGKSPVAGEVYFPNVLELIDMGKWGSR